jgi:hypothetical protein
MANGTEVPVDTVAENEVLKEQKAGGRKWKEVQAGAENDATEPAKPQKHAKKTVGQSCPFINPFKDTLLIPEPTLSVMEHEPHSHLLSQSHAADTTNPVAIGGQSAFTKSLLETARHPIPALALDVPELIPTKSSPVKQNSHTIKPKPICTPARNALTLAPLPSSKTKIKTHQSRNIQHTTCSPSISCSFVLVIDNLGSFPFRNTCIVSNRCLQPIAHSLCQKDPPENSCRQ